MPMYEYSCTACGNEFEELVFKEDTPVKCTKCGSDKTKKLISRCRHKHGDGPGIPAAMPSSGGSSCSSCAGGNCSTCH